MPRKSGCLTATQAIEHAIINDEIYAGHSAQSKYVAIDGDSVTLEGLFHVSELQALVAVMTAQETICHTIP